MGKALLVRAWAWLAGAWPASTRATAATTDGSTFAPDAVQPATCQGTAAGRVFRRRRASPSEDTGDARPVRLEERRHQGRRVRQRHRHEPGAAGLAFARTDVGGAYRFDPANQRWMPMTDWVGHANSNLIGIESIAVDPVDPEPGLPGRRRVPHAGNGAILSSTDMGQTWTTNAIAAPMGGNVDGRSMGERLAVDPNLPSVLYFGSRNAGPVEEHGLGARPGRRSRALPTTRRHHRRGRSGNSAGTGYGLTFVRSMPTSGAPGSADAR